MREAVDGFTADANRSTASKSLLIWDLVRLMCRQPISFTLYRSYARQGFIFCFSVAIMWLLIL